jgi:hypothetical protein
MDFTTYLSYFRNLLEYKLETLPVLYQDPAYFEYTKLNWSRQSRWMKTGKLAENIVSKIKAIQTPQNWIVITEPWCGDASHIVPFIELMSRENELITVSYELRDTEPTRIDNYLTNAGKAIPILIIQDQNKKDIAVWGPRPAKCQQIFLDAKNQGADMDVLKTILQQWYNADKGNEIQQEIGALLK